MKNWLLPLVLPWLLSGCLLQGFGLPDSYQPQHSGAAEPVASGATFVRPADREGEPVTFLRFQRTNPNRYVLEAFVDDPDEAMLVIQRVAFIPLAEGWHAMYWSIPDERIRKHGYSLVRFRDGRLETLDPASQFERVAQLAKLASLNPQRTITGDIDLAASSEGKLIEFLRAVVSTPNPTLRAFSSAASVPRALETTGYRALVAQVSRLPDSSDKVFMSEVEGWFRVLERAGQGLGAYGLARLYGNGWGVSQMGGLAREYADKAIARGYPEAHQILGATLFYGIGVPRDPARAIPHFQRAAEADVPASYFALGTAYRYGEGVAKDRGQARAWFEKAVKAGRWDANAELAAILLEDRTDASTARAVELIEQGVAENQARSFYMRAKIHMQGSLGKVDWKKAFADYLRAAELGHPQAQYVVGGMLLDGMGTRQDTVHGRYWLRRAADAGVADAQRWLKESGLPNWAAIPRVAYWSKERYAGEDKDYGESPRSTPVASGFGSGGTPLRVPGARTVSTHEVMWLLKTQPAPVVIDVYSDKESLPGALNLKGFGRYRSEKGRIQQTRAVLDPLTSGDRNRPLILLCVSARCWHSYNAALYALEAGYSDVLWYRGGLLSWKVAKQETAVPREIVWKQGMP